MTPTSEEARPEIPAGSPDRLERRKRMRVFQSELVERMQAARDNVDTRENLLGIQVERTRWLLDLQEIGEIVPVTAITQVPLTQDWYLGLLNIRGNLVSVIDFSRYQGLEATEIENASRIVTFAPSLGINCGLLVSRVMGLRNVAEMQRQPDNGYKAAGWIGSSYRDNDSQDWVTLSLSSIAQEQRFLHIGM